MPEIVVLLISGHPRALEVVTEAGLSVDGAFEKPLDLVGILGALAQAGVLPPKQAPAVAVEGPPPRSVPRAGGVSW